MRRLVTSLLGLALFSACRKTPEAAPLPEGFLRGMTVSCPRDGQIWGTPAFAETLRELRTLGVTHVAIHPYAGIDRSGRVRFRPAEEVGYLKRAIAHARAAGVALFWKPHLAYWGRFAWRGAIGFGDEEAAWARFFETYRGFILDQARFAARAEVPIFAIGTELELTVGHAREWKELIAEVRSIYPGHLTYAANWDGLGKVPFWDALDSIGVQAYFPVEHGWKAALEELAALHQTHRRPVLFTEIGYPNAAHAARTPWETERGHAPDPELRGRLVREALALRAPFIMGMFWWKWMPGGRREDFSMHAAPAREAVADAWRPVHRAVASP